MVDQRVVAYIKSQMAKGVAATTIKQLLLTRGWKQPAIEEAFRSLSQTSSQPAPKNFNFIEKKQRTFSLAFLSKYKKIVIGSVSFVVIILISYTLIQTDAGSALLKLLHITTEPSEVVWVDPKVTDWKEYENNEYHFKLEIPYGWDMKIYTSVGDTKDLMTKFAFSPSILPAYWASDEVFVWVGVYPVTDERNYPFYQTRVTGLENNEPRYTYSVSHLGNELAILTGDNLVSIERNGYVYEMHLQVMVNKKIDYEDSPILHRIYNSFEFTELLIK